MKEQLFIVCSLVFGFFVIFIDTIASSNITTTELYLLIVHKNQTITKSRFHLKDFDI